MGRAILLCGNDAKTPYRIKNPNVFVYSIEELCYILQENAFLLDSDIMDKKMINWISSECGLKELAEQLYPFINQKGTVSSFVLTILEYVGYYEREALRNVEVLMKQSANLSIYEKMKNRVDYIVENGKHDEALREYDVLLSKLPKEEIELRAKIIHNKGVVLAKMFLFGQAASCFKVAYKLKGDTESLIQFLAAKRIQLNDREYIEFVAQAVELYDISLELEKKVESLTRAWADSEQKQKLEQLKRQKEDGEAMQYYEEVDTIFQNLKQDYRFNVSE